MRAHTLACLVVLCLLGAGCSADVPTAPDIPATAAPLHDGIGWTGGGGRSADSTTTASAAGIGWVGGGG